MTVHIDRLLETGFCIGATDIHLRAGQPPILRVDGVLRSLETAVLSADDIVALTRAVAPARPSREAAWPNPFAFDFAAKGRLRGIAATSDAGPTLDLCLHPPQAMRLEDGPLPEVMKRMCMYKRGLVLIGGPQGAGRTTVLRSFLQYLATYVGGMIATVERPVEVRLERGRAALTQHEVGRHTADGAMAVRQASCIGADIIAVDLPGDHAALAAAVDLAATSRLVLAAVDGHGAADILRRANAAMSGAGVPGAAQRLADALAVVASLVLLPRTDAGLVAAAELLLTTLNCSRLIAEERFDRIDEVLAAGTTIGMQLLDERLFALYSTGVARDEHVIAVARNRAAMHRRIEQFKEEQDKPPADAGS